MTQFDLFAAAADPPPAVSRYRKRLARVAAQAYEIGKRGAAGGAKRRIAPHSLSSAAVQTVSFYPTRDEANELLAIAARLARLSISRTKPHEFFEVRSDLVCELRRIAKR